MKKIDQRQSFTLIELMTVIGIIAILAGLMLVGYNIFFSEANIGSSMRFDSSIHHSLGYALVGDWKMDDNAANSTVVDTSGNGNDGTFYSDGSEDNTANHSVDGANNRALSFDGDDYIDCGDKSDFDLADTDHTISLWYKTTAEDDLYLIDKFTGGDSGAGYVISVGSGTIRYNERTTEENSLSITKVVQNDNHWHHFLATVDVSLKKGVLYSDGEKITTDEYAGNLINQNEPLKIGGGFWYWNGGIDQVRIYRAALSASQIKQQYYTGLQRLYKKGLISREEYIKRVVRK